MNYQQISKPIIIKVCLLISILGIVLFGYWLFTPEQLPKKPYKLIVYRGESLTSLALNLESSGLITQPRLFQLLARLLGKDRKIIAGMYILQNSVSPWAIINRLSNGHPDEISITILEGHTFKSLFKVLNQETQVRHTYMSESELIGYLKITYPSLEGILYPDTYFIAPGQSDLELIEIAYKTMQYKLQNIWQTRNSNTVYKNPYELLIMASLIQKETANESDMIAISTVFNNRLRIKMRLQDDPAVFYGLGNQEIIIRKDFAINTPYNTYLHYGLPPTPICNPSLNALKAAANPGANYKLLYFIATTNGKTKFSTNFKDHLQAIKVAK